MRYTKEESDSRKVIAIGLATYYTLRGYRHVTLSCFGDGAEVTIYVDTKEELEKAEKESRMSILDGCTMQTKEWDNEIGHYYSYSVEY